MFSLVYRVSEFFISAEKANQTPALNRALTFFMSHVTTVGQYPSLCIISENKSNYFTPWNSLLTTWGHLAPYNPGSAKGLPVRPSLIPLSGEISSSIHPSFYFFLKSSPVQFGPTKTRPCAGNLPSLQVSTQRERTRKHVQKKISRVFFPPTLSLM